MTHVGLHLESVQEKSLEFFFAMKHILERKDCDKPLRRRFKHGAPCHQSPFLIRTRLLSRWDSAQLGNFFLHPCTAVLATVTAVIEPRGAFRPDDALKPRSPTFFWRQGLVSQQMDVSTDRGVGVWFRDSSTWHFFHALYFHS